MATDLFTDKTKDLNLEGGNMDGGSTTKMSPNRSGWSLADGTGADAPPLPPPPGQSSGTSQTGNTKAQSGTSTTSITTAPVLGNVTDNMLVRNQLNQMLSENGPYLDQARQRAIQLANGRGLQNSSLAGMAGEEAAISAAMPAAQQDANTYSNVQSQNVSTQNTWGLADKQETMQRQLTADQLANQYKIASEGNQTQLAAASMQMAAASANAAASRELGMAEIASREKMAMWQKDDNALNRDFQARLQQAGFDQQTLLADKQLTAQNQLTLMNLNQNTFVNFGTQYATIMANTSMTAADRQNAINNLLGYYAANPYFPYKPTTPPPPPPQPPPPPPSGN